jgi:hypothetical protein
METLLSLPIARLMDRNCRKYKISGCTPTAAYQDPRSFPQPQGSHTCDLMTHGDCHSLGRSCRSSQVIDVKWCHSEGAYRTFHGAQQGAPSSRGRDCLGGAVLISHLVLFRGPATLSPLDTDDSSPLPSFSSSPSTLISSSNRSPCRSPRARSSLSF